MNKVATGFLVLLAAAGLAQAAERADKLELGVAGGVSKYWGDLDAGDYNLLGQGDLHWWMTDQFAIGLRGMGTILRAEEDNVGFETPLTAVAGRIKWLPFKDAALLPYLTAGAEWISFNAEDSEDEDEHTAWHDPTKESETSSLAIPVGLGLMHHLGDNWAISLEGLYHYSMTEYLDDWDIGEDNDGFFTVTAGLSLFPGAPKDTDGDGIFDKLDKCPNEPEDNDGFQDLDGCPDPDNDEDGVLDVNDKCPKVKEDLDGFQDADGCPDPDNDGDGILDVNDKCPNEKEDFDGFQDEDGCPDPDNDGDGMLDAKDKCPNEPETVNGYQDTDGCPDKKPEIAVEQGKAIVLEGITFDSGKATLKPTSEETLGKVLRTLQENPEIEVEIRGHTDSQGAAEMNRKLSQDRANTVKAWLVERGIAETRIQTKGYGPDEPVADNTTPEGRAQNRRIEFYRVK